jgi:predicted flap endonuclease-1-like 5' DNA nuclease
VVDANTDQSVTVRLDQPQPNVEIRLENPPAATAEPAPDLIVPTADQGPDSYFPVSEPGVSESINPPDLVVTPIVGPRDDLKILEGIGPKIEELLNQFGIRTYRELSETSVQRLREILQAAGPQMTMHDPGTWPAQASLAAMADWEKLRTYQFFLKSGKYPGTR